MSETYTPSQPQSRIPGQRKRRRNRADREADLAAQEQALGMEAPELSPEDRALMDDVRFAGPAGDVPQVDPEAVPPPPSNTPAPAPSPQAALQQQEDRLGGAPELTAEEKMLMAAASAPGPISGVVGETEFSLPDDAPGDDRTDRALMARYEEQERQTALEWLKASASSAGGAAKAVAKDVATGIVEAPSQILGGARDAAQAALGLIDSVGDWLARRAADVGLESEERAAELSSEQNVPELPEVREAKSGTGGMIRGVSQFLIGFGAAGTAIKVGGKVGAVLKGGTSDFAFFEGQEENLANLIQEHPALANPVTEFLATHPDDGEAANRLKRAVEGLGLGVATDAFVTTLRSIRSYRAAAATDPMRRAQTEAANLRRLGTEPDVGAARDMLLLGSPDAPLTVKGEDMATGKYRAAFEETEPGVPLDIAARSLTDAGLTPLGTGEVFVNFSRIDGADDLKRVIQDVATAMKPEIDDARRGTQSFGQTAAAAEGLDPFDIVIQRRRGQALNAEESYALRNLWVAAGTKLQEVSRLATANPSPENLFQFRKMMATFHAIQKEALGARAEAGRALSSWRIPAGGSRRQMAAIEAAMANHGGLEVTADLARKISSIDDPAVLGEFVEKSFYAKTLSTVQEYWINSILSGPKTHMVNMISNSFVIGLTMAETAAAARLGRLLGGENVVEAGEAMAQAYGAVTGFKDALRNAGKSWRTGETGFGIGKIEGARTRAISSDNWNLRSDSWVGSGVDALGAIVNIPGRALGAEDEFFKTIGYRMSLHSQAYRQVQREISEGKLSVMRAKERLADLVMNPTEDMSLEAAAQAAYQTFTDEPGPLVRWVMQGRSKRPELKFIIPFVNTPANIFKYTFERTPIAPLTARYRAAIAKGGAEADLARTKMAIGTLTMMTALDLAMNGHITGSGPSKFSERDNFRRQGVQPYSVKIGNQYYAYNRLDPLGAQLGMAAELAEYLVNSGELDDEDVENYTRAFAASVFSVAETVTSKTYMTGLTDLIEAIQDPDRFGETYVKRFAGGFVPTFVREVKSAMDPTQRYTVGLIDEMKSRVPGLSETLPARRDLWGREINFESGLGASYDAVSPIYSSTYKPEPIDLAMKEGGWFVGMPGKAFSYQGTPIRLRDRPDVYSRLLELQGVVKPSEMGEAGSKLLELYGEDMSALDTLNAMVEGRHPTLSPEWEAAGGDPDVQEGLTRKVIGRFRDAAKDVIMQEFPELLGAR